MLLGVMVTAVGAQLLVVINNVANAAKVQKTRLNMTKFKFNFHATTY